VTLKLPEGVLAQHIIALGKSGSGKSSKLRVLVESLLDADKPVCIIDPKGDWWGIKSSADGKKAGYPLVVFGGEHADVPINESSGMHVAELIATGNRSCLIDLGGWMVGERTRFFIDFASCLFKYARGARHLVIDEVHNFAPQGKVLNPDAGKMLHWANRLASEGRGKGITLIVASQRPQKVHKDLVTSCETLIANKVIHKLDRDSVKDWIDGCADPLKGREVIASLAQLKKPQAWVWCPEIDYGPVLLEFPMFKTYDSFKPQQASQGKLKGWADVDLDEVKTKLAALLKNAQANDPAELRRRIAELEREAKKPRDMAMDANLLKAKFQEGVEAGVAKVMADADKYWDSIDLWFTKKPARLTFYAPSVPMKKPIFAPLKPENIGIVISVNGENKLSKAARKILSVLAQFREEGCAVGKLTLLTGYRYSGSFQNALSELRSKGCIEGANNDVMYITNSGISHGPFPELPQGDALIQYWLSHPSLSKASRLILGKLVDGQARTADELCEATGYSYSGSFQNALSELRTAGVLVGKNGEKMRMSPDLI
jgi:uncharacterized protein